jgi:hypothetical protein
VRLDQISDADLSAELARQQRIAASVAPESEAGIQAARVIHHLVREQARRRPYWHSSDDTATQCVLQDMGERPA